MRTTVRCPHCHFRVPDDAPTRCPVCGGALRPLYQGTASVAGAADGGSLIEKYSRQIEASRRAWESRPAAAGSVAEALTAADGGIEYQEAAAPAAAPYLEVRTPGALNLLLLHAGYSPFSSLTLHSSGASGGAGTELRVTSRPAVFRPTATPVHAPAGALELPVPAPDYDLFFALDETVRGELEAEVVRDGRSLARRTVAVAVHGASEWIHRPGCEAALAGAVTPNAPAVADFVAGIGGDFLAYQGGERARVGREVEALHDAVRRFAPRYLGAPPSYESGGQKVLFPDQVLASRQGCCLDLTVLHAALLERLGYHPLVVLLRDGERRWGHACCAVWTSDVRARSPVLGERRVVEQAVADGDLLVWDATRPCDSSDAVASFAGARAAGEELLRHFELALDVAACRAHGFKPVPRRGR